MGSEACEKTVMSCEELGSGGAVEYIGNLIFLLRSYGGSTGLHTWCSLFKKTHKIHIQNAHMKSAYERGGACGKDHSSSW